MNTKSGNIVLRVSTKLLCLAFVLLTVAGARSTPIIKKPLPFSFITKLPQNEFLFIFVEDDDSTCLDNLCQCPVSQPPTYPFEFQGDKLILKQSFFQEVPIDWLSFREGRNAIALYGDYSLKVAQLQTFSSFPMKTPVGGFTILGANLQGDIQVRVNGQYVIIPQGSTSGTTRPQQYSLHCKVLHEYTLTNYGFIKDGNVEFY